MMYITLINLNNMTNTKQNSKTTNFILGIVSLTSIIVCNILASQGETTELVTVFAALSIVTLLMTD